MIAAVLLPGCTAATPHVETPETEKVPFSFYHEYEPADLGLMVTLPQGGTNCTLDSRSHGGFDTETGLMSYATWWGDNQTGVVLRVEDAMVYRGDVSSSSTAWKVLSDRGYSWGAESRGNLTNLTRHLITGFDIRSDGSDRSSARLDCTGQIAGFQYYRAEQLIPIFSAGSPGRGVSSYTMAGTSVEHTEGWQRTIEASGGPVILAFHSWPAPSSVGVGLNQGLLHIDTPGGEEKISLGSEWLNVTRTWDEQGTYTIGIDRTAVNSHAAFGVLAELRLEKSEGMLLPIQPHGGTR